MGVSLLLTLHLVQICLTSIQNFQSSVQQQHFSFVCCTQIQPQFLPNYFPNLNPVNLCSLLHVLTSVFRTDNLYRLPLLTSLTNLTLFVSPHTLRITKESKVSFCCLCIHHKLPKFLDKFDYSFLYRFEEVSLALLNHPSLVDWLRIALIDV